MVGLGRVSVRVFGGTDCRTRSARWISPLVCLYIKCREGTIFERVPPGKLTSSIFLWGCCARDLRKGTWMLLSRWCFALSFCLLAASPMLEAFDPLLISGGFRGAGAQIRQGSIRFLPLRGGGARSGARITSLASAQHPISSLFRRRLNVGRSTKQASGDGSEAVVSQTRQAWEIVKFAIPALSIPLCDPIMSCVDVVCIGQYGTTLEVGQLEKPDAFTAQSISLLFPLHAVHSLTLITNFARESCQVAF